MLFFTLSTIINEENKLVENLTPLFVAVEVGDCEKIKLLISKNDIDIDSINTIELFGDVKDRHEIIAYINLCYPIMLKSLNF